MMALDIVTGATGIASVITGIAAILLTFSARRRMSNPHLLGYVKYVLGVMVSLLLFSSWHTVRVLFGLKEIYGPVIELPEYALVILICVLLLLGARSILRMSREYGFREQGTKRAKEGER